MPMEQPFLPLLQQLLLLILLILAFEAFSGPVSKVPYYVACHHTDAGFLLLSRLHSVIFHKLSLFLVQGKLVVVLFLSLYCTMTILVKIITIVTFRMRCMSVRPPANNQVGKKRVVTPTSLVASLLYQYNLQHVCL